MTGKFRRGRAGVRHPCKIVPQLGYAMEQTEAGNITLAEAAGVNANTVQKAKRGEGIEPRLADCIMQAICTRTFSKPKASNRRGRKSRYCDLDINP